MTLLFLYSPRTRNLPADQECMLLQKLVASPELSKWAKMEENVRHRSNSSVSHYQLWYLGSSWAYVRRQLYLIPMRQIRRHGPPFSNQAQGLLVALWSELRHDLHRKLSLLIHKTWNYSTHKTGQRKGTAVASTNPQLTIWMKGTLHVMDVRDAHPNKSRAMCHCNCISLKISLSPLYFFKCFISPACRANRQF